MKKKFKQVKKPLKKNTQATSSKTVWAQMNEPRPLPMGRKEFEEWSDRIISGALLPLPEDVSGAEVFIQSQKFALGSMILHLGPTESHKPDAFFIHSLRKVVANQVAHAVSQEYRDVVKAKVAADEEAKKTEDEAKKLKAVPDEAAAAT